MPSLVCCSTSWSHFVGLMTYMVLGISWPCPQFPIGPAGIWKCSNNKYHERIVRLDWSKLFWPIETTFAHSKVPLHICDAMFESWSVMSSSVSAYVTHLFHAQFSPSVQSGTPLLKENQLRTYYKFMVRIPQGSQLKCNRVEVVAAWTWTMRMRKAVGRDSADVSGWNE